MRSYGFLVVGAVLLAGCSEKPEYVNHCKGCIAKGLERCVHCDAKGFDTCLCGGPRAAMAMADAEKGKGAAAVEIANPVAFAHAFVEPPKVGDVILKLTTDDARKASLKAFAEYDMPSMRGAHATKVQFRLNKKGDFVIPIHFAMPGDWEIVVTFEDADGKLAARKVITLDI